jgi:predicted phosphoadenosine phosphosulfate sulfurtransferase
LNYFVLCLPMLVANAVSTVYSNWDSWQTN